MFPTFKSLAQRESKRQELLTKAERRKSQSAQKRAMYEIADWASDQGKNITLSKSKTSLETQTDASYLRDGVKPPFLKTSPIKSTNVGLNPESMDVDDSGVTTNGTTVEGMDESEPMDTEADATVKPDESMFDEDDQQEARSAIRKWYVNHPDWKFLRINPIKRNGETAGQFYIGESGRVYRGSSNKITRANRLLAEIDWVQTHSAIENIYFDEQSNSIDEVSLMRMEDKQPNSLKRKGQSRDDRDVKRQFYSPDADNGTQSSHDQINAYARLLRDMLRYEARLGTYNLHPEVQDGFRFNDGKSKTDYAIRIDMDKFLKLFVESTDTQRATPSVREAVDWQDTLMAFHALLESRGIDSSDSKGKTLTANPDRFKSDEDGQSMKGKRTGTNEPGLLPRILSNDEAKSMISDYFKSLAEKNISLPFRLNPVVSLNNKPSVDKKRYFVDPEDGVYLILRTKTGRNHPKLSPSNTRALFKRTNWSATLDSLVEGLVTLSNLVDDPESGLSEDQLASIRSKLTIFEDVLNQDGRSMREPLPRDEGPQTPRGQGLVGRGLRGAGMYHNIERRGKTYNLNDIQGSSLASAYLYRPIGSKYIRIPDLDNKILNVVFPSRKKLGPKRAISSSLQSMLKTLIYDSKIDQASYDQLDHDDQVLFREILAATHIQHTFKETMSDPLESLKAEYEKLKGEIDLGNDNPSIIKQLKVITVDVYRNKLISDKEFKDMIIRL